jgi:CHAD domain-containing protein
MQPFLGSTIIDGSMSTQDVAWAVLRKHLGAMLAKEEGTRLGEDPEQLHDMRVATRRLRAAMSLFRPYLSPDILALSDEFRWIAGVLGAVRDLDVQTEHLRNWLTEIDLSLSRDLRGWLRSLQSSRRKRRSELVEALDSPRYRELVSLSSSVFLNPQSVLEGKEGILTTAPLLTLRRWKKLRRAVSALGVESPAEAFHAVRILAKRFRYTVEFVGPVYGPLAKDASVATAAVQDVLGLHQDLQVTLGLIEARLPVEMKKGNSRAAFGLGRLRQFIDDRSVVQRTLLPETFKKLERKAWPAFHEEMSRRLKSVPEVVVDEPWTGER